MAKRMVKAKYIIKSFKKMLERIKSQYCLRFIIKDHLTEKKYLSIFSYNNQFKKKLGISFNDYINIY